MNKPKEIITTVGEGDLSENTHQETDEHEAGGSAQVVVNMNTKPPSKAFRKNWNRRQAGRGRGRGSLREGSGSSEADLKRRSWSVVRKVSSHGQRIAV